MAEPLQNLPQEIKEFIADLPRQLAEEAVDYFVENIEEGKDVNGKPFEQRDPDLRPGGAVLQKRGNLRDSIRVTSNAGGEVRIAAGNSSVPYAQIHNEGGEITVTAAMKKFFWAMHIKAGKKSQVAEGWKALALKKVGSKITIPQRQYIGESEELERRLEELIQEKLDSLF